MNTGYYSFKKTAKKLEWIEHGAWHKSHEKEVTRICKELSEKYTDAKFEIVQVSQPKTYKQMRDLEYPPNKHGDHLAISIKFKDDAAEAYFIFCETDGCNI